LLNRTKLFKFNNLLFEFKKTLLFIEVTSFMQWLPILRCTINISIFVAFDHTQFALANPDEIYTCRLKYNPRQLTILLEWQLRKNQLNRDQYAWPHALMQASITLAAKRYHACT